jgi:hypothetical protein
MKCDAVFSPCGEYRYVLRREWDARRRPLVYLMLNPSTADETLDDPTMRKCIGFAHRAGRGGIVVVNLFALRSRNPATLLRHPRPIGPNNDDWIRRETTTTDAVVVGWGANVRVHRAREREVLSMIKRPLLALGVTKDGHPCHPGRIGYANTLRPWAVPES